MTKIHKQLFSFVLIIFFKFQIGNYVTKEKLIDT